MRARAEDTEPVPGSDLRAVAPSRRRADSGEDPAIGLTGGERGRGGRLHRSGGSRRVGGGEELIRRAVAEDSGALCALLLRCPQSGSSAALATDRTPDFFRRAGPFAEAWVLAVEGGSGTLDATVTVAVKHVDGAGRRVVAGYVFDLAVEPAARGRGLAGRMVREAEELAIAAGADLLYAHVMAGNVASSATFARAGYEQRATIVARIFLAEGEPDGGGGHRSAVDERDIESPDPVHDWDAAAAVIAGAERGHDLARSHDGASLRGEWTGLHGWNSADAWHQRGALLGLWDYAAVARYVQSVEGPSQPGGAESLRAGMLLGGAGDEATLAGLFATALARAEMRGMQAVFTGYDERATPTWFGDREAIAEPYKLMARVIRAGPAERLGDRPVRVDPIDL